MLKQMKRRRVLTTPEARCLNHKVANLQGFVAKEGMLFGLELELEGNGVSLDDNPFGWKQVEEGSLRGEATEYVFSKPVAFDLSKKRIVDLFKSLHANDAVLNASYRTSTHVHLNFGDKTPKQVYNFFLLHTVMEEVFERYCGDTRGGNLFCLSCRDNEQLVDLLDQALFTFNNFSSFNNEVRYNACNLAAINKFGSIEIRTMRGADTPEQVVDWLNILNQLYVFVCKEDCPPPWKLCENLSYLGSHGFLSQMFDADTIAKLLKTWPAALDLHRSLMNGVRLMQMLSYKLQESWEKPFVFEQGVIIDPFMEAKVDWHARVGNIEEQVQAGARMMRLPDNPIPQLMGENGHDQVVLPNGGHWWVDRQDKIQAGYSFDCDGHRFRYNKLLKCFIDEDNEEIILRWTIFQGVALDRGSANEYRINRVYYMRLDERDEEEQNEEEEEDRRDGDF